MQHGSRHTLDFTSIGSSSSQSLWLLKGLGKAQATMQPGLETLSPSDPKSSPLRDDGSYRHFAQESVWACVHEHMLADSFCTLFEVLPQNKQKHIVVVSGLLTILQSQDSVSQLKASVSKERSASQSHRQNRHLPGDIHPCSPADRCQGLQKGHSPGKVDEQLVRPK